MRNETNAAELTELDFARNSPLVWHLDLRQFVIEYLPLRIELQECIIEGFAPKPYPRRCRECSDPRCSSLEKAAMSETQTLAAENPKSRFQSSAVRTSVRHAAKVVDWEKLASVRHT